MRNEFEQFMYAVRVQQDDVEEKLKGVLQDVAELEAMRHTFKEWQHEHRMQFAVLNQTVTELNKDRYLFAQKIKILEQQLKESHAEQVRNRIAERRSSNNSNTSRRRQHSTSRSNTDAAKAQGWCCCTIMQNIFRICIVQACM
jgi:hypothetical protein